MSRRMSLVIPVVGILTLFASAGTASAQWFNPFNQCCCPRPVAQACYRTVPVTQYQPVTQTVQRPVWETEWIDQPVTEYRPVVEKKTVDVPHVTYHNVTEYRTVRRNCGRWVTQQHAIPRVSPCAYDPRPDFLGWINRTGYSLRMSFTPRYVASRQYIPQTVAQQIPVTRRVAHHSTRKVTYHVTKMVPHKTTRKVAVRKVRYVTQTVTVQRPVTVMRTVPIGSRFAFSPYNSYGSYGYPTATALAPIPDPISSAGSSRSPRRSANSQSDRYRQKRNSNNRRRGVKAGGASYSSPVNQNNVTSGPQANQAGSKRFSSVPSVVRVRRGWKPSRASRGISMPSGPVLAANAE